jgi:hypothetical protein
MILRATTRTYSEFRAQVKSNSSTPECTYGLGTMEAELGTALGTCQAWEVGIRCIADNRTSTAGNRTPPAIGL